MRANSFILIMKEIYLPEGDSSYFLDFLPLINLRTLMESD